MRIDIDKIGPHSKVLNLISGDLFRNKIVETSLVAGFLCKDFKKEEDRLGSLRLTGEAEVFNNKDVSLLLDIHISKKKNYCATVNVGFKRGRLPNVPPSLMFECVRYTKFFRCIKIDIDYEDRSYCLPVFRTAWHKNLHEKYGDMEFTVFDAFKEAGIELAMVEEFSGDIIEDPDETDDWDIGELLSKMKTALEEWSTQPQHWAIWFLIADRFAPKSLKGIMFDFFEDKGRNGAAVFVDLHRNLPPWQRFNQPRTKEEVKALWDYLFTCVHEIGHTLNLSHSCEKRPFSSKDRKDALSWMNYPEEYVDGEKHGYRDFFIGFQFEFDRAELMFMRHGFYDNVKPGHSSFCGLKFLRELKVHTDHAKKLLEPVKDMLPVC